MAYKKHVFPLFLDAATVTTAAAGALAVTTSYHIVTPGAAEVAYTAADGTIPGQMMVIITTHASNDANITFASPLNEAANLISLDSTGKQCMAMWNGSAWVIIGGESADIVV